MRSIRLVVGALGCAALGAVAASMFPVHAQMPEPFGRLRPGGTFRLNMTAGGVTLPSFATFEPGGGIVGTTVPLSCLGPGQQFGGMHGAWDVTLDRGRPVLRFHLMSDIYQLVPAVIPSGGDVFPIDSGPGAPSETTFVGSVEIFGTTPITTGPIKGEGTIAIPPGPCAQRYNGAVTFTAFELPAVQKVPIDTAK